MRAYLAAVSAVALSMALAACADFPSPQYPVSRSQAEDLTPPPPPEPPRAAAPAPPTPAPARDDDDAPRAHPTAPVQRSTLPPPAAPRPGAFLDRGLDVGRPAMMSAVWRDDGQARLWLAATHHKAKAKAKPKAKEDGSGDETVTVGKGDTLAAIARAHESSIEELAKLNGLKSPYRLTAGQSLKLPGPATSDEPASSQAKSKTASADKVESVKVGKGDTLAAISRKSGVSIAELARINGLEEPYRLKAGQTIQLKATEEAASDEAPSRTRAKATKALAGSDEEAAAPSTSTITVRRKDTIQSLAKQAHVSVADLARLNHLKKPYRLHAGQQVKLPDQPGAVSSRAVVAEEEERAAPTVVTAGRKDTLKGIADKHGVSLETLAKLNHIKKPYRIHRGQRIRLPGHAAEAERVRSTTYTVQSGDTLYSIARRFGTDARSLAELNGMDAGDRLSAGRRIRLPGVAEDRIAPKPNRSVASTADTSTPVPYASLPSNPPTPSAPGLAPPPPSSTASLSSQLAPYKPPTAPPVEAPAPGDAEVAAAGKGLFEWPVKGDIIQRFGPLAGGQRSDGVDIRDAAGTPVVAAASGEVVYAGNSLPGFGNMVLLRHDGGWVTVYAHLASLDVKMRQTVNQGQTIGAVGQSGGVSQPQLHFEVRYAPSAKDKPRTIDPMLVLPQG
jgi:murein DD-endopeptidase MepM/ murein hydrolase activator NlpD